MLSKSDLNKFDFKLIIAVTLISIIGILAIYSAGFDPIDKVNSGMYKRQLLWFIVGFVVMIGMTFINYKQLGEFSLYLYGGILLVLIGTTFLGPSIRNTRAWIPLGIASIQPSEFMKLAVVILLAKYLEIREREIHHFRELALPALIVLVPVTFILLQPDFGTAMIFIPVLFVMLFVGGADALQLFSIVGLGGIAVIIPMAITYREWVGEQGSNVLIEFLKGSKALYVVSGTLFVIAVVCYIMHLIFIRKIFRKIYIPSIVISLGLFMSVIFQHYLKDYQKKRILVFLNPDLDPHGSGYNVIQAKIAIGSGGFFGKGFLKGSQAQLGFLPEKTSDFIFGVVAEQWGFLGALLLLGLLFFVTFRGIQISLEAKDKFGALLAVGITTIFFFHVVINVGMALGVMPVTGLPLVFVSYGGSNMLMAMIAVGILNNIRMRKFAN